MAYARHILPEHSLFNESFSYPHEGVFADKAVSGWNKPFSSRPAGSLITEKAVAGDHIIFYSIDRFARNIRDFANTVHMFEAKGVSIHFILDEVNTSTAAGRLKMHIRAAVAQFSSDLQSERMREAFAIRALLAGKDVKVKPKKLLWTPSEFTGQGTDSGGRPYGTIYRYERVSTISQYTNGLGLQNQSATTLTYAKRLADRTPSVLGEAISDEAVSAYHVPFAKRPGGKRLLEMVKPGDDVVIYRCDRAWRNLKDAVHMAEMLKDRGVYLHFVKEAIRTDSIDGADWLAVMAAMAQLDSSIKARRGRDIRERLIRQGRPIGRVGVGWKAKQINSNQQKLALDFKGGTPCVAAWLLKTQYSFTTDQTREAWCAWQCRDKDKAIKLTDLQHSGAVSRLLKQAENIKSKVPQRTWDRFIELAHEVITEPMEPRYWRIFRWDYNTAIQERVVKHLTC